MSPNWPRRSARSAQQLPGLALGDPAGAAARAGAHDGWLPPEAFARGRRDALDLTPAYCQAVASFYDMFHLAPVGRHIGRGLHQPLVRPRRRAAAWSRPSSPSSASRRRDDRGRRDHLPRVECLGGCGYAPVVAVDHRYRQPVRPDDVPGDREGAPWRRLERPPRGRRRARPDEARRVPGDRRLRRRCAKALAMSSDDLIARAPDVEPARPRRRRLPDGPQGAP